MDRSALIGRERLLGTEIGIGTRTKVDSIWRGREKPSHHCGCHVVGEQLLPCNCWKGIGSMRVFSTESTYRPFLMAQRLFQDLTKSWVTMWGMSGHRLQRSREKVPLTTHICYDYSALCSTGDQETTPSSSASDRVPLTATYPMTLVPQGLFVANLYLRLYNSPLCVFNTTSWFLFQRVTITNHHLCYLAYWW